MKDGDTDTHPVYKQSEPRFSLLHVLLAIFIGVAAVVAVVLISGINRWAA